MANEFGVSANFIDRELSELIAARRLPCKIDKVSGIIETDPTDERNNCYKNAVKRGDHLLNQIQKLSRAIDVWYPMHSSLNYNYRMNMNL